MKQETMNAWLNAFFAGLFAAAIAYVGSKGLVLLIYFFPVPLVVTFYSGSILQGLLSLMTCFLPLGFLLDVPSTVILMTIGIPLALFIGRGFKASASYSKMLLFVTGAMFSLWLLLILVGDLILDIHFVQDVEAGVRAVFSELIRQSTDLLPAEKVQALQMEVNASINLLMVVMPSIGLLFAGFFAVSNFLVSYWILRRISPSLRSLPPLGALSLPQSFKMGMTVTVFGGLVLYLVGFQYIKELAYNIGTLFSVAMIFQGLACADAWLKPRVGIFGRIILPLFLIFIAQLYPIYGLIGMFDLYFPLRRNKGKGGSL